MANNQTTFNALITAVQNNQSTLPPYLLNGVLDLSSQSITNADCLLLAAALQHSTSVKTLNLRSNFIGASGASSLADALQVNTVLQALNLHSNSIGASGASSLAGALQVNTALQVLSLQHNSIGASGASSLADALQVNTVLQELYLHNNSIGASGTSSLANALKINTVLQVLDLESNSIGDSEASSLVDALQVNTVLKTLYLSFNSIGDSGASSLATALRVNTALQTLSLFYNSIGDSGAQALATMLKENDSLTYLDLGGNPISETGKANLLAALENNYSIIFLSLGTDVYQNTVNPFLIRNQQYPSFTANQLRITQSTPGACSIKLTSENFNVVDYNNIPRNFTFTVTDVRNGKIFPSNTFTQQQLNNGNVSFVYAGTGTPAYNITASNGNFTTPNPRSGAVTFIPYTIARQFTTTRAPTTTSVSNFSTVSPTPFTPMTMSPSMGSQCVPALSGTSSGASALPGIVAGVVAGVAALGGAAAWYVRKQRTAKIHVLPTNTLAMMHNSAYSNITTASTSAEWDQYATGEQPPVVPSRAWDPNQYKTGGQVARERLDSQGYNIPDQPRPLGSYEQFAFKNPAHPAAAAAAAPHQWNSQTYTTGQKALMRTPTKWEQEKYVVAGHHHQVDALTYDRPDDDLDDA